jgi:hypothetical protein
MSRQIAVVLYMGAIVVVIVGVDLVFFRNRFWERLMVNIGIVKFQKLPISAPPAAPSATRIQGGICHIYKSKKATAASAKS